MTLAAAQDLARRGFYVFPIRKGGKKPAHKGWQDEATNDPDRVAVLWGNRPFNVGVYTGRYGAGQALLVVDVDSPDHGAGTKNGPRRLLELELEGKDFPLTLEHVTPTGGRHLVYVVEEAVKQGVDVLGAGLDIRSAGGYIVAPGSQVDAGRYFTDRPAAPVAAPTWLVDACGKPRPKALNREPLPGVDPERARARGVEYLKTAERSVKGQGGDQCAYRVAAKLLELGNDNAATLDLMLSEHWDHGCGWAAQRLAEKVDHAERYMHEPRGAGAPEALFEAVEDSFEGAETWNAEAIKANAQALYNLHRYERARFDQLAKAWDMLGAIEPSGLHQVLANAALRGMGADIEGRATPADPSLRRGLAELQKSDAEAFAWVRDTLEARGMQRRAINDATKDGRRLLAAEGVAAARRKDKRTLVAYRQSNVAATVDEIEQALLADVSSEPVFKHGAGYVCVRQAAPVTVRELTGGGEYPPMAILHRYDAHSMAERISRSIRIEASTGSDGEPKAIAPPEQAVRMLLARGGGRAPVITGIIEAPTVREDGSVICAEGYDSATGLYAVFGGQSFDVATGTPNQSDAAEALAFLEKELFAEFPFADGIDQTAAVAAVLTGMLRPTLCGSAPGFLLSSPTQSTGKTALAQAICHAAYGRPAPAQSWPGGEDEMSKFLLGALREGQRAVVFDNLADGTVVNSAELASAMTSDTYSRRLLGSHDTVTVPTAVLWMITGNNVRPAGDMPSRLVEIYLDAKTERPDQRRYSRQLAPWISNHRAQIVAAAVTVVRAYIAAGCPGAAEQPSRFPKWDRMVRFPLIHAGGADVAQKFDKGYAGDPALAAWRDVLALWRDVFEGQEIRAKDLASLADRAPFDGSRSELAGALADAVGGQHRALTAKVVAHQLGRYENRPIGGLRLCSRLDRDKVKLWRVETLTAE